MKSFSKLIAQLSFLSLVVACALGINYLSAASWLGPTALPPNNNVAAPLNISTTNQVKDANLSIGHSTNIATDYGLIAYGRIRSTIGGVEFPDGTVQASAATGGTFASMQCATATSAYVSGAASVACSVGYTAVSGGCQSACSMLKENYLTGNTQMCAITNTAGSGICNQAGQTNVRANILCCK